MSNKCNTIPKLCLCMIVKDEGHIIAKTLENLIEKLPIDYWVISDTGSTDNTIDEIVSVFKKHNISGELFRDEWKDFGYNRSKVLNYAYKKSEYLIVFDADDCICGDIKLPQIMDKDGYFLGYGTAHGIHFTRLSIVNNMKKWCYIGVMHEYIECLEKPCALGQIEGKYYIAPNAVVGNRNKAPTEKYFKDALILEKAYEEALEKKDPIYERYAFYCANCFRDSEKPINAIKWYKIVLKQNNWVQEKYISCLRLFHCYKAINQVETGFYYLVESFKYDDTRAECLFELLLHYSVDNQTNIVYHYYRLFKDFYEKNYKEEPTNKLFLDVSKFNFYLPYHMIIACYYQQQFESGIVMYKIIFYKKFKEFNPFYVKHIFFNLQFYIDKVDPSDTEFFTLYKEYLKFLIENKYPISDHAEFITKYKKYIVNINKKEETEKEKEREKERERQEKEKEETENKKVCSIKIDNLSISKESNTISINEPMPKDNEKNKDIVIAILAKNEGHSLEYYLDCIYKQTYDKKLIHLYIRTNDNTDNTEQILYDFVQKHKNEYASIYFNNVSVSDELKTYTKHEWDAGRFTILGKIRQESINYAIKLNAHYFVVDCDNFIVPDTLQLMADTSNDGVLAPMLHYHVTDTTNKPHVPQYNNYSNYHDIVTDNGYYTASDRYFNIRWNKLTGIHNVGVVHCSYFINNKFLDKINYNDDSARHEYVIFSDILRKNKIDQFIDNTKFYGFISFAENKEEFTATLDYWKENMNEETTTINI